MTLRIHILRGDRSSHQGLPVHDRQLARHRRLPFPGIGGAVTNIHRFQAEAIEHPPDIWVIVDAYHGLALASPHEFGHPLVLLQTKFPAVPSCLPVRRIHIVKGVRPIVFFGALQPGQVLNAGSGKTLPGLR